MQMFNRNCLRFVFAIAALTSCAVSAQGPFPSKPIRMIVPTAGGTVDLIARIVATGLSEAWGQPVIVDTKAGASGNIAAAYVAKAAPDGHTILTGFNPLAISSFGSKNLPYTLKDFSPITLAVSSEQVLVVNPAVPASTLAEFIAHAKASKGGLNYGSISAGSASHLTMELFKTRAGVDLKHIPYKGAAPALMDLLGGTTQAGVFAAANVIQYVKEGRLKALAVTGKKRLKSLPDVPSMAEAGFSNFNATIWIGFLAPSAVPKPIIRKYHEEIARILRSSEVRAPIEAAEFEVVANKPEEFDSFIQSEIKFWQRVVEQSGTKFE